MSDERNFNDGPLSGIRVLDLTSVVMGPFATHILADQGADVVKIESPEGDSTRNYRPLRNDGMSGMFLNLHRNKRSLMLDLKQEKGRAALRRLVTSADVLIHNMRPRAMARLGFDYQAVKAINPDIIYCGAYGFGAAGPYGDKAAYDDLIQAGSGVASLIGRTYGEPGYVPNVICDKLSGQAIAWAVLAALVQRLRGGGGQEIEVPMFETSAEFNLVEHMSGGAFDPPLSRMGFPRLMSRRRKPYRTKNGYACILPYSDENWHDFFDFVGRANLKTEPKFAALSSRVQHIDELYTLIEDMAPQHTTEEWVEFCDAHSIPCMPVLDLDDLQHDAHLQAVGLIQSDEHPSEGRYKVVRSPVSMSGHRFRLRRHAPRLGEQSVEILQEAGFDDQEIASMMAAGATGTIERR